MKQILRVAAHLLGKPLQFLWRHPACLRAIARPALGPPAINQQPGHVDLLDKSPPRVDIRGRKPYVRKSVHRLPLVTNRNRMAALDRIGVRDRQPGDHRRDNDGIATPESDSAIQPLLQFAVPAGQHVKHLVREQVSHETGTARKEARGHHDRLAARVRGVVFERGIGLDEQYAAGHPPLHAFEKARQPLDGQRQVALLLLRPFQSSVPHETHESRPRPRRPRPSISPTAPRR